jgi:quercetin dioxygenase-like cupin family protein
MGRCIRPCRLAARVSDDRDQVARARLTAEGVDVSAWANGPGDRYAAHDHAYDKVLVAVRGSITFRLTTLDTAIELVAGDRLDLPAGTIHAAEVGPRGVRCLEGHLSAGSLGREPRRMADWAAGSRPPAQETDGDGET